MKTYLLNLHRDLPAGFPSPWRGHMDYLLHSELIFYAHEPIENLADNNGRVSVEGWRIPINVFSEVAIPAGLLDIESDTVHYGINRQTLTLVSEEYRALDGDISLAPYVRSRAVEIKSLDNVSVFTESAMHASMEFIPLDASHAPIRGYTSVLLPAYVSSAEALARKIAEFAPVQIVEPRTFWSSSRTREVNFTSNYLKTQIRTRYAFANRPRSGVTSPIMDTFFPRLAYRYDMRVDQIADGETTSMPATACAISPLVASLLNVRQVSTEQLCRVLGYTMKDIKGILRKVKAKNYRFVFVGAGGTGMNGLHWMSELVDMTGTVNLFKEVHVYEKEDVEVSNLFRFPIDPRTISMRNNEPKPKKLDLTASMASKLSRERPNLAGRYIPEETQSARTGRTRKSWPSEIYRGDPDLNGRTVRTDIPTVLYGAPSLAARTEIGQYGHFISGTHANNSCHLWLNPEQETDLQVESYGMIQLGGFFMNQLRMVLGLLEFLGQEDIDWLEKDKEILDYSFDGERKLPTDRMYNWQMDVRSTVMTEREADNNV